MPALSGSFSGTIRSQSIVSVPDQFDHTLSLAEDAGTHRSTDPKRDKSQINYWGATDVVGNQGIQRGYFVNDYGAAGLDRGTFVGISGGGTFKTRLPSPTSVEATWEGNYELASAEATAV